MIRSSHPVAQEELMAYLDGELPLARAHECAAHLAECAQCQALAGDLKAVYQQMSAWQVGPLPEAVTGGVSAALADSVREVRENEVQAALWRRIRQRLTGNWAWAVATVAGLALIAALTAHNLMVRRESGFTNSGNELDTFARIYKPRPPANAELGPYQRVPASQQHFADGLQQLKEQAEASTQRYQEAVRVFQERELSESLSNDLASATPPAPQAATAPGDQVQENSTLQATMHPAPMIARTASLNLVAKDFERARTELDSILRRHNGYAADLKIEAPQDQARTLTASLRVPADQFDAAMAELKKLGRVEQESQGGEEVTSQYVDLNARLSNDRNTEQRLLQILDQRAGKLSHVLAVEQEIARVRGEIEQMATERKSLEKRVAYTSIDIQIKEEYKAALQMAPPSTLAQMRNSFVDGVQSAADSLIGLARFLLYAGPTLLLWALILFFPVRFVWRRWRAAPSQKGSA